jgi:histone H3/H4
VRAYISEKSGMNTSASTYEALSEKIRIICDKAMDEARAQGRKTVLDRDVL